MMDILEISEWSTGAQGTYEMSALLVNDKLCQGGVPRHSQPDPDKGMGSCSSVSLETLLTPLQGNQHMAEQNDKDFSIPSA